MVDVASSYIDVPFAFIIALIATSTAYHNRILAIHTLSKATLCTRRSGLSAALSKLSTMLLTKYAYTLIRNNINYKVVAFCTRSRAYYIDKIAPDKVNGLGESTGYTAGVSSHGFGNGDDGDGGEGGGDS